MHSDGPSLRINEPDGSLNPEAVRLTKVTVMAGRASVTASLTDAAPVTPKRHEARDNMKVGSLRFARVLISLAFLISFVSLFETLSHVWDPEYYIPTLTDGPEHARFHFLREFASSVGKIIAVCVILFQPERWRTPALWWVMVILVVSYYAGFWIGYPVLGVGAPNTAARVIHTSTTVLGLAGVLLARQGFSRPGLNAMVDRSS
jgi:hypothetical protein